MQNLVLDKLYDMGQEELTSLFSDDSLSKGQSYTNNEKVVSWRWRPKNYQNSDILDVIVAGSGKKSYDVSVFLGYNGKLDYMCTCPAYDSYKECKHGAAVFITAINRLSNPLFKHSTLNKALIANFNQPENAVLISKDNAVEIHVVNNINGNGTIVKVETRTPDIKINPKIEATFNRAIKAKSAEAHSKEMTSLLKIALEKNILFAKTSQGALQPKKLDDSFFVDQKTLFISDAGKTVTVVPIAEKPDRSRIQQFVMLTGPHIMDIESKIIYLTKIVQYSPWDFITKNSAKNTTENLTDIYKGRILDVTGNGLPLISLASEVHDALKNKLLFVNTQGQNSLKHVTPRYSVHIKTESDFCGLAIYAEFENETVSLQSALHSFVRSLHDVLKDQFAYNIEYFIQDIIIMLSKIPETANSIDKKIKQETLSNISNGKHGRYLNEKVLSNWIDGMQNAILHHLNSFHHIYIATKDGRILYAPISIRSVLKVAAEALIAWPNGQFHLSSYANVLMSTKKVHLTKYMRKFVVASKKDKIAVFLDKKLLKVSSAQISINASRSDFDWFEIKPEIRIDDRMLSESDWLEMINLGQRETTSSIELVDEDTEKMLNLLKRYFSQKGSKLGEKEEEGRVLVETRPLKIFELLEFKNNKIELRLPKEEQEILDSLGRFKKLKPEALPAKLSATLRPYQHDGFSWLAFLYKHKFGACLADDMGLGKTVQAITFLGHLSEKNAGQPDKKPHLIVLPPSLIFNWISEFEKFYTNLKVADYSGAQRKNIPMDADVVVTTYDMIRIDIEKFEKEKFDVIIFDEAQAVKNLFSQRTGAVRKLNGKFKLCLTGTPLENNISEFYSIMDLALPGLLPEYEEFKSWDPQEQLNYAVERTRPFILRRKKEVILDELPEKSENDIYLPMTDTQKTIYKKIVDEIKNTISDAYKSKTKAQATIIALTALLRLRQVCVSQQLIVPAKKEVSPKIAHLIEKLEELKEEGHAALVFSQFTSCLDIVETHLNKSKIKFLRIDGSVPVKQRKDIVEQFQDNKSKITVLLLSLKTGGVGLNLTRANYVFHIDPWWNPAVENQASDRAYRIGQKQHVIVTRLLMKHSIEEKMMKLKQEKAELFAAVVEGTQAKRTSALSKKDFDFLLS